MTGVPPELGGGSRGQWHPGSNLQRQASAEGEGGPLSLSLSVEQARVSSSPKPQKLTFKVLLRAASFDSPKQSCLVPQDTAQVTHLKQFPQNRIQLVLNSGESWQPLCGFFKKTS